MKTFECLIIILAVTVLQVEDGFSCGGKQVECKEGGDKLNDGLEAVCDELEMQYKQIFRRNS